MSKSFRNAPDVKIHRPGMRTGESKASLRARALNEYYSENEPGEDYIRNGNGKISFAVFMVILAPVIISSCVSKRMLIQEQDKSLRYIEELADCREQNTVLGNENKDLSSTILLDRDYHPS
jgi:hypothetical protein